MAGKLVVRDLIKRYGDFKAVRGVSFDVAAGEIFGLLGPNGAGKTSAVECIVGLRKPDGGSIELCGIDALLHPEQVKERIGVALQSTALQDKITPREALALFRSFYAKRVPISRHLSADFRSMKRPMPRSIRSPAGNANGLPWRWRL